MRRVVISLGWAFLLFACPLFAQNRERNLAIAAAKNLRPDCKGCVYFALKAQSHFVKNHSLYFVSTLDSIPSSFWTVGVSRTGKTFLLSAKNLTEWNALFAAEKATIKPAQELEEFAKEFVRFAVGDALYIGNFKIVQERDPIQFSFVGKNLSEKLQTWTLAIEPNGKILKTAVSER